MPARLIHEACAGLTARRVSRGGRGPSRVRRRTTLARAAIGRVGPDGRVGPYVRVGPYQTTGIMRSVGCTSSYRPPGILQPGSLAHPRGGRQLPGPVRAGKPGGYGGIPGGRVSSGRNGLANRGPDNGPRQYVGMMWQDVQAVGYRGSSDAVKRGPRYVRVMSRARPARDTDTSSARPIPRSGASRTTSP